MILDEPSSRAPTTSSSLSPPDAPSSSTSSPHRRSSSSTSSSAGLSMRLRVGTRLAAVPTPSTTENIRLEDFDGPYQLSEYLSRLVAQEGGRGKAIDKLIRTPGEGEGEGSTSMEWVDADVWLYEHLLRLPPDLTPLITSLLACCTPETCPDMRAGEWQYLCAAHPRLAVNKDCTAVDYVLHTLDSITSMLNSSRVFPSRLSIPPTSHQNLKNIARRLSRIFGHAYSFHREVFEACEEETSLYRRFLALSEQFALVDARELAIPSERFLDPEPASNQTGDADDSERNGSIPEDKEEEDEWEFNGRGTTRGPRAKGGRTVQEFAIGESNEDNDDDDDESSSSEEDDEDRDEEHNSSSIHLSQGLGLIPPTDEPRSSPPRNGPLNTALPLSPSPSPSPPRTNVYTSTTASHIPIATINTNLLSESTLPSAIPTHTHLKPLSPSLNLALPPKSFLGSPIMLSSPPSSTKTSPINATGTTTSSVRGKSVSPNAKAGDRTTSRSPPSSTNHGSFLPVPIVSPVASPAKEVSPSTPLNGGGGGKRTRTTTAIKAPSTFTVAAGGKSIGRKEGGRMVKAAGRGGGGGGEFGNGWREGREKEKKEGGGGEKVDESLL